MFRFLLMTCPGELINRPWLSANTTQFDFCAFRSTESTQIARTSVILAETFATAEQQRGVAKVEKPLAFPDSQVNDAQKREEVELRG